MRSRAAQDVQWWMPTRSSRAPERASGRAFCVGTDASSCKAG